MYKHNILEKQMNNPLKTNWLLRLKLKFFKKNVQSIEDFNQVLIHAEQQAIISHSSYELINSVVQIAHIQVRDVMTPRNKIISIDTDMNTDKILETISNSAYSRFPVFNNDEFMGILLAKDILNHLIQNPDTAISISEYLRPPEIVPNSKPLELLLKEFQINKNHMVLVVDEYKSITGLLTIEDVIEQIVGEIEDEHDFEEDNIIDHGDGRYLVRANTPLEEFNTFFGSHLSHPNASTVSGVVLGGFERMPKQLESIELFDFLFKVLKSNQRQLQLLEVSQLPQNSKKPKAKD